MRLVRVAFATLWAAGCVTAPPRPPPPSRTPPAGPPAGAAERPSAPDVARLPDCAPAECPPRAMGMPNWECADGRRGGPACRRTQGAGCGWVVMDCEPAPLPEPAFPPPDPVRTLRPPPAPQGLQDLGTWTPVAGDPVAPGEARLVGASSLRLAGGGVASVGGSSLRYLAPGDRRWTVVQRQPGDNVYRLGVDGAGERLLVAWERDPLLHVFSLRDRRHLAFPRPPAPGGRAELIHLESVSFSADGGSALVVMADRTPRHAGPVTVWRVPLDGSGPAEQVVRTDGALLVASGSYGAIFALPPSARQRCAPAECFPNAAALVAWEVGPGGARQRTLLAGSQHPLRRFRPLRAEDPGLVAIELSDAQERRSLLLYRPGEEAVELAPLAPDRTVGRAVTRPIVAHGGRELVSLRKVGLDLEIDRTRLDGGKPRRGARLAAPVNHDQPVSGLGLRDEGALWLLWGDHLALVDGDGTPRAVDLSPLAGRGAEWAGVVEDEAAGALWIGVEVGARRDWIRLPLAEAERRARAWPRRPEGCRELPDVETLLRWPIQKYGGCSGGIPNPRAPPPVPPVIVRTLPDGTKIIDAGARGCVRAVEDTCRKK